MKQKMWPNTKKHPIIKKISFLGYFLLCTACLSATGCSAGQEAGESENDVLVIDHLEEEFSYNTTTVSVQDVILTAKLNCVYRQAEESEINISNIGRTVEKVYVKKGDIVTEGQLLAMLSGGDREEAIRDLKYKIARNQLLLDYTEEEEIHELSYRWWTYLYRSSQSEQDTQQLEKDLEAIRKRYRYLREDYQDAIALDTQQLEFYQQEMKECRIYADISGEVIKISSYIQGSVITEERQLLVISDRSQCFFESNQKMYAGSFHEGDVVELVLSSGGNTIYLDVMPVNMENWDAKLSFKIVSGDASAVSVGTYGSINFVVDSRMQVLAVPKSCVHRTEGGESYVYILNSNNVREMKKVTVGLRGDDMTEIIDGLTEGEEILLQ